MKKFFSKFLYLFVLVFIIFVFLDQNFRRVPVKLLIGEPIHFDLSVIILLSVLAGVIITLLSLLLYQKQRQSWLKRKDKSGDSQD